jgi:hypothetical protein
VKQSISPVAAIIVIAIVVIVVGAIGYFGTKGKRDATEQTNVDLKAQMQQAGEYQQEQEAERRGMREQPEGSGPR